MLFRSKNVHTVYTLQVSTIELRLGECITHTIIKKSLIKQRPWGMGRWSKLGHLMSLVVDLSMWPHILNPIPAVHSVSASCSRRPGTSPPRQCPPHGARLVWPTSSSLFIIHNILVFMWRVEGEANIETVHVHPPPIITHPLICLIVCN